MRGIKSFNAPAFNAADDALQAAGHETFNPARVDEAQGFDLIGRDGTEDLTDIGFNLRDTLGADLAWIAEHADGVATLPGSYRSKGARAEMATAEALGLPVCSVDYWVEDGAVVPGPFRTPEMAAFLEQMTAYSTDLAKTLDVPVELLAPAEPYTPAMGDRVRIVDADYLEGCAYIGTVTDLAARPAWSTAHRPHPIQVTDDDGLQWYAVEVELISTAAEEAGFHTWAAGEDAAYVASQSGAEGDETGWRQRFICGVDPSADYARAADVEGQSGQTYVEYDHEVLVGKPPPEYPTPEVRTLRAMGAGAIAEQWVGEHGPEVVKIRRGGIVVPNEVRVTSETGGAKGSKPARFDLIPTGPLWELAEHYGKGAVKYERVNGKDNWRNGYDWSLSYAALQRHANAFWEGEDIDPENGSKHIIAAAWHCLALAHFMDDDDLQEMFDDRQEGV